MKQIDEKLVVYKQHKQFLDMLAISSGRKVAKQKNKDNDKKNELKVDNSAKIASRVSRKEP